MASFEPNLDPPEHRQTACLAPTATNPSPTTLTSRLICPGASEVGRSTSARVIAPMNTGLIMGNTFTSE